MRYRGAIIFALCQCLLFAVVIDRIDVIVSDSIIKQSDIDQYIRITDFLNNQPLDLSLAKRKDAVNRLIDQVFIRREIRVGGYPVATLQEADAEIDRLMEQRFKTKAAFDQALNRYGLTELELRMQFRWQLTVLRFIDVRFKPAVFVTDEEIGNYYHQHAAALHRQYPRESMDQLHDKIRVLLTEQGVNKEFFAWLDQQREDTKIRYLEASLK